MIFQNSSPFRFCRINSSLIGSIKQLDVLKQSNPNLSVDLSDNPLHCSCDCLYAIRWMLRHPQLFKDIRKYTCTFDDLTEATFPHDLDFIVRKLEGECLYMWWIWGPISISLMVMVLVVIGTLTCRCYSAPKVSWYKPGSAENEIEYEFDSFIVYNERDRNWVQNHLCPNLELNNPPGLEDLSASRDTNNYKLCCHHRYFIIGMHIIDNITEAFDKSRTTLVVVSNAAVHGNYWQLELQMAVQTAVARRTSSLLFVFLEPLKGHLVTTLLRRILNIYTCKRWYPGDHAKQQKLWKDLKIAMKFPRRNGLESVAI